MEGPFRVTGWQVTIVIECNQCRKVLGFDLDDPTNAAAHTLILPGAVAVSCPGCGATYQFVCFSVDGKKILPHLVGLDIVSTMRVDRLREMQEMIGDRKAAKE